MPARALACPVACTLACPLACPLARTLARTLACALACALACTLACPLGTQARKEALELRAAGGGCLAVACMDTHCGTRHRCHTRSSRHTAPAVQQLEAVPHQMGRQLHGCRVQDSIHQAIRADATSQRKGDVAQPSCADVRTPCQRPEPSTVNDKRTAPTRAPPTSICAEWCPRHPRAVLRPSLTRS